MKIVYKKEVLEVLDIYIINYPPFKFKDKQYNNDVYIAVRTNIYTFEVNGKSKAFNIINNTLLPKDYINKMCKYSGKLSIIYDTILEKNYFENTIKFKNA